MSTSIRTIILFLLLFDIGLADRGFMFQDPAKGVSEPNQTAIVAYRNFKEILILATAVDTKATGRLVEFIPFPSEPTVSAANPKVTSAIGDLVRERFITGWVTRSKGLEVIRRQQIESHSLTTLHVTDLEALRVYVRDNLDRDLTEREVELLQSYIEADFTYFVLDQLDLDAKTEAVTPLMYEFTTDAIYYPLRTSNLADGDGTVQLLFLTDLTSESYELHQNLSYGLDRFFQHSPDQLGMGQDKIRVSQPSPLSQGHLASLDPELQELLPHGGLATLLAYHGPLKFLDDPFFGGPTDSVNVTVEDSRMFWSALKDNDHKELLRLLERDVTFVRERTDELESPLHVAAQIEAPGLIELLLSNGADLDVRDHSGLRPIHHAARSGQLAALQSLLQAGSKARDRDDYQHPIQLTGAPTVIKLLAPDVETHELREAAFAAAERGQLEGVKAFIEAGFPLRYTDGRGNLLHVAAESGSVELIEWILDQGFAVDVRGIRDSEPTPFLVACRTGNLEAAKTLLEAGADPTKHGVLRFSFGGVGTGRSMSAADAAVVGEHPETLKFALAQGAEISSAIYQGKTPVHFAAIQERPEVLEILVEQGVPLDTEDDAGHTPLYYARKFERDQSVKVLLDAGVVDK
jgi:ankyrin repeat protein